MTLSETGSLDQRGARGREVLVWLYRRIRYYLSDMHLVTLAGLQRRDCLTRQGLADTILR